MQAEAPGSVEDRAALRELLAWYAAMGVDTALEEAAIDRFVPAPIAPEPSPPPEAPPPSYYSDSLPDRPVRPTGGPVLASAEETERAAKAVAAEARTLDELREALSRFEGCSLRLTATNLVFGDGTPGSRVMLVGEAPGRDEDLQGLPFVGRSGQLLDRMLTAIGLGRSDVYIANVVPWRPPGNRTPTPQETAACRPFIQRQIELSNPDVLVCLGGAAAKELFGTAEGILRLRGRWRQHDTGARTIRAMAMLHPAYLLRQPAHKRLAWRDLLMLKAALDAPVAG